MSVNATGHTQAGMRRSSSGRRSSRGVWQELWLANRSLTEWAVTGAYAVFLLITMFLVGNPLVSWCADGRPMPRIASASHLFRWLRRNDQSYDGTARALGALRIAFLFGAAFVCLLLVFDPRYRAAIAVRYRNPPPLLLSRCRRVYRQIEKRYLRRQRFVEDGRHDVRRQRRLICHPRHFWPLSTPSGLAVSFSDLSFWDSTIASQRCRGDSAGCRGVGWRSSFRPPRCLLWMGTGMVRRLSLAAVTWGSPVLLMRVKLMRQPPPARPGAAQGADPRCRSAAAAPRCRVATGFTFSTSTLAMRGSSTPGSADQKFGVREASVGRVPAPFLGGRIPPSPITAAPMCRVAPISSPSTPPSIGMSNRGGCQEIGTSANELARTRALRSACKCEQAIFHCFCS